MPPNPTLLAVRHCVELERRRWMRFLPAQGTARLTTSGKSWTAQSLVVSSPVAFRKPELVQ